jgi:phosphopantothenoylcysteine decarboxylase/phosphopantothenate--cysteine ligase
LAGRTVLLGVTGGISTYKVAELARLLVKAGAYVKVMMTEAGRPPSLFAR